MTPQDGDTLQARFAARMGHLLGPDFPQHIALAVSGGGDSMAMLGLAHGWARVMGIGLWVVTVDHGLRPGSADEADMVARECAALGHPHAILRWHWDGHGNLQDAARKARLRLIDQWRAGIAHVLFAHTRDDVAETFLMRLARGSGVEGLSAMAETRIVTPSPGDRLPIPQGDITAAQRPPPGRSGDGFHLIRPLLHAPRAELRHYLDTLRIPYVDDPSNDDPRFERVRARRALEALSGLGISAQTLVDTASRMARAREALRRRAVDAAIAVCRPDPRETGHVVFERDGFAAIERDTQLRLLAAALQWVSNAPYRPRSRPLEALLDRALAGGGGVLHGAQVTAGVRDLRVFREYAAVRALSVEAGSGALWDGMWRAETKRSEGLALRALGQDGWVQIVEKPHDAPPHEAALSLPALFDGESLVACPALAVGGRVHITARRQATSFVAFLQLR